ncbi:MAG TPA: glycerophosphoryl diester phosphodiesterase membrane domain-containing protein [Acidimicrobiales bacterium]
MPIRPLRLGEILDHSFRLLRHQAKVLVTITAIFVVPLNIVTGWLTRDLFGGLGLGEVLDDPTTTQTVVDGGDATGALASLASLLTSAVVLPLIAGGVVAVVADAYLGRPTSVPDALGLIRRRGLGLIGAWFLSHLLVFTVALLPLAAVIGMALAGVEVDSAIAVGITVIGLAMGTLVALAVAARFMVVAPALVEERLGPWRAIRRSWRLVRGRVWSVVGVWLVSGLLASVLSTVLSGPAQIVGLAVGMDQWGWLLVAAGTIVAQLVVTPFTAIVATLVYFDLRIRSEGFDLALLADEVRARSDGQP